MNGFLLFATSAHHYVESQCPIKEIWMPKDKNSSVQDNMKQPANEKNASIAADISSNEVSHLESDQLA